MNESLSRVGVAALLALLCQGCADDASSRCETPDCDGAPRARQSPPAQAASRSRALCVVDEASHQVLVFDAAQLGAGPPLRRLGTDIAKLQPRGVAFDPAHDELFVAEATRISVWGSGDSGDRAPRRAIRGSASSVAYDPEREQVYATTEEGLRVYPRLASGAGDALVLRKILRGPDARWSRVAYDDARRELVVLASTTGARDDRIYVFDRDATAALPRYTRQAPHRQIGLAVDAQVGDVYTVDDGGPGAPACVTRLQRDDAAAALSAQATWCLPGDAPEVIAFDADPKLGAVLLARRAGASDTLEVHDLVTGAPKYTIDGSHTRLLRTPIRHLRVNPATQEIVVASESGELLFFPGAGEGPTRRDLVPRRIGRPFAGGNHALAVDRARAELYVGGPEDPYIHVLSLDTGAALRMLHDPARPGASTLAFDAAQDHLLAHFEALSTYARTTGEVLVPRTTPLRGGHAMALDELLQRAYLIGTEGVAHFETTPGAAGSGSTTDLGFVASRAYAFAGKLYLRAASADAWRVYELSGTPPVLSSDSVRTLDSPGGSSVADDLVADPRTDELFASAYGAGEIRVHALSEHASAAPRRVLRDAQPGAKLGDLELCK